MPEGRLSGSWAFRRKSGRNGGNESNKTSETLDDRETPALPRRMQNDKLTGGLVRVWSLKNSGVEGMVWGLGAQEPLREEYPGNSEGEEMAWTEELTQGCGLYREQFGLLCFRLTVSCKFISSELMIMLTSPPFLPLKKKKKGVNTEVS